MLVHASQTMTHWDYEWALNYAIEVSTFTKQLPAFAALERGGIVGSVEIVDCVRDDLSPWFQGPYGFKLAQPQGLPFHQCKGALKFFRVP